VQDVEEACEYMARTSERFARIFAVEVVALAEAILAMPRLGGMVPEYERDDLRERILHNYRVIYRLRGEDVEIVAVTHGARRLPPNLAR
jgi:plasmid stabilization system protein ParE